MNRRWAVSLGFSVKSLVNFFIGVAFYNGTLYFGTKDGNVLAGKIPNTRVILNGNQVSFQLLSPNGDQVVIVGIVKCWADDGTFRASTLSIWEKKYVINCSPVEIAGLELVYVLALLENSAANVIHKNIKFTFVLLMLIFVDMAIIIFTFVSLNV